MVGGRNNEESKSKYWCVVPGCTSDSRKKCKPDKYPWMQNVSFEPFPTKKKEPKLRAKWVTMIRRPLGYEPLSHHRVCSRHFVGNCRSDSHPIPELFPWNDYKSESSSRSSQSITKREQKSSTSFSGESVSRSMSTQEQSDNHTSCHVLKDFGNLYLFLNHF